MESDATESTIDLTFEGQNIRFRIGDPPRCGHHDQLRLTGKIFESIPRQFEVMCQCGCGYGGIAYSVKELEEAEKYF